MERLEQLERDRDALMEHYADVMPSSLDALTLGERHQLYKRLRLKVVAHSDNSLEVSGAILGEGGADREGPGGGGPGGATPSGGLGALLISA
jgi:hypothetical protein